jgi:hypothetical protein
MNLIPSCRLPRLERRPVPRLCSLFVFVLAAWLAPTAFASEIVADRNVRNPTIKVNKQGQALIQYTREDGTRRHVLFWNAVNAVANSDEGRPQVKFKIDYAGGWGAFRKANYWKTFRNACRRYDGPSLFGFVAGCKAPDGSYWALQNWVRLEAMRGFAPFKKVHTDVELHISHWTGALPVLDVWPNWTYSGRLQGFFGRLTYDGKAVYGTRSPSPTVTDPYARNVYIDTFNSIYGRGWKRDTGINTHKRNGAFCYSFVAQSPPGGYPGTKGGYPSNEPRGPGLGDRHRITVMGPGVTPVLRWEGARLGAHDIVRDAAINGLFDQVLGGDEKCAGER